MPVKIVQNGTSSQEGTISFNDLLKCIENFKREVAITTISPRDTIVRTRSIWFDSKEILKLIGVPEEQLEEISPKYAGMRIYLTVHPDQNTCSGSKDYANHLSVALLPTDEQELDIMNDHTLIPGFKSYPDRKGASGCCGNIKPPPPDSLYFK
jgi:hypothetical protein